MSVVNDVAHVPTLDRAARDALASARHSDPFAVLGPHQIDGRRLVRTLQPDARAVEVVDAEGNLLATLQRDGDSDLFAGWVPGSGRYRLRVHWPQATQDVDDVYAFGPQLSDLDLHLHGEGTHQQLYRQLGAQAQVVDGVTGVRFAVWAPNAQRVSVIGEFNQWDGRRHPMRLRAPAGVWELFVPAVATGALYKYEILGRDGVARQKADPLALATEMPPGTASRVADPAPFDWSDAAWISQRPQQQALTAPLSIYELHAGSWVHGEHEETLDWDALGERLIPYVTSMGFTHIELLPIAEYPFGGSWGYQPLGQFAPTARFGPPQAFARFVDRCHEAKLGVIVDWVPAHFPTDAHGLAQFDGTPLYEHADPREGFHQDWNTLIYNLGRNEVAGFLVASALAWFDRFHVDGLRVDAVASMLYRDYSRKSGEWVPNIHGGRENLESIAFLRTVNDLVHQHFPGALMIAEESTAWPGVTRSPADGGLGFDLKWNMGWMHDTLEYMARDPAHRRWHHHEMTFSMVYAWSERFVLPLSHDEVVHGKRSLLGRMPGDEWQRFASLRAYLGYMWAHPGRKLLFNGAEIGQPGEWNHDAQLPWNLLDEPHHRGVQQWVRDLNHLYTSEPALHALDDDPRGFRWLVGDDADNSVLAWLRLADDARPVLVVSNFTPAPRHAYRVGVPRGGVWHMALNSDASVYGGSAVGQSQVDAEALPAHGQPCSLALTLPPTATIILTAGNQ